MSSRQPFPINYAPGMQLVDPKTGRATAVFDRMMFLLIQRTGGAAGPMVSSGSTTTSQPSDNNP